MSLQIPLSCRSNMMLLAALLALGVMEVVEAIEPQSVASSAGGRAQLPEVPAELIDPAFAGKVDLAAIRDAIGALDAKALIDEAAKLFLAEQQLGKKHKSLNFGALVDLALRITGDKHDSAALDHITEVLSRLQTKDFDEKIAATKLLMERPRKISAGPNVPTSETTPGAIVLYNALMKQVKTALLVGDRRALASLRQKIQALQELHPKQRQHLFSLCDEAIASLPSNIPAESLALSKLSAPYLQ